MARESILFVLSGPSGVGKATVLRKVLERVPDLRKIVTFTTRQPRPGEVAGFDYFFLSREEFFRRVAEGEIFEYEQVYGDDYFYGSPRPDFSSGDQIIELDHRGFSTYQRHFASRMVSVFLLPPSLQELKRRLDTRGSTPNLELRLEQALVQLGYAAQYDYLVLNDDADRAADAVAGIVRAERCRREREELLERAEAIRQSGRTASRHPLSSR